MIYQLIISQEAELDIQDAFEWYEQGSCSSGNGNRVGSIIIKNQKQV